eukprot:TRINITY_DN11059_c0_g1_i1.p1 TRINITY_DN11059_c0_g1~~TRINITY_DN11059_c0_g1_i1.p1  ORF type:complete len:244 (+),score=44.46 TRINITY_DN11059_c0_g1_i1:93-824(+)
MCIRDSSSGEQWGMLLSSCRHPRLSRVFTAAAMAEQLRSIKNALRKTHRSKLRSMSDEDILEASRAVAVRLSEMPEYQQSTAVGCFLSMPKEFNTRPLLELIFQDGKRCFVPRVESVESSLMSMLEAESLRDIDGFERGAWDIPEPRSHRAEGSNEMELLLVPGLAFDRAGGRMGQGAGFYDRYLGRVEKNDKLITLIGVTLDELMVEQVPRDEFDSLMHWVLSPGSTINVRPHPHMGVKPGA